MKLTKGRFTYNSHATEKSPFWITAVIVYTQTDAVTVRIRHGLKLTASFNFKKYIFQKNTLSKMMITRWVYCVWFVINAFLCVAWVLFDFKNQKPPVMICFMPILFCVLHNLKNILLLDHSLSIFPCWIRIWSRFTLNKRKIFYSQKNKKKSTIYKVLNFVYKYVFYPHLSNLYLR